MTVQHCEHVQTSLEQASLVQGVTRYSVAQARQHELGELADTEYSLLRGTLPVVSDGLSEWLREEQAATRRHHQGTKDLSLLDTDLLAFAGLQACFTGVASNAPVRQICRMIGQAVEDEIYAQAMLERDPKVFKRVMSVVKKGNASIRRRRKAVRVIMAKEESALQTWDDPRRTKTGEPVLNAVLKYSGLFQLCQEGKKTFIGLTTEGSALLEKMVGRAQWMEPLFKPMVIKPRKWETFDSGAYMDRRLSSRVPLVRTFDQAGKRRVKAAVKSGSMDRVLSALNAIQDTPFRINQTVLQAVKHHWDKGTTIPKFPRREHLPATVFPDNYEELDPRERKWWRLQARKTITRNRAVDANHVSMVLTIGTAETLTQFERFWLPHNLDFRGRVYPVPNFSHHRADYIKSMLEFADGKPLGESGGYWLSIHLANTGDFDKVSKKGLGDRVKWVLDNKDMILRIAADPLGNEEWLAADKPFSFLAACVEWAGYHEHGPAFVSHLPISLDGSNSGIQHYSAALRDESGGRTVNLVPMDVPQDIYAEVAEHVRELVAQDRGTREADQWLAFGIDRKVVKRNVMTFPYSSERFGFREQLIEDHMRPLSEKVLDGELPEHPFGEDEGRAAALYMANKVWQAVNEVVQGAASGMNFLRNCAGLLAHERKPMRWVSPIGFPVTHDYRDWDVKVVSLSLHSRALPVVAGEEGATPLARIEANLRTRPKEKINKHRQKNAVAPNLIHSLDAAHLMLTVEAAASEGITSFCLIHDSFATHAADTDRFFDIIRETFVKMYEETDPFDAIYKETLNELSEKGQKKLSRPPSKGNLDLGGVLTSLYAFA